MWLHSGDCQKITRRRGGVRSERRRPPITSGVALFDQAATTGNPSLTRRGSGVWFSLLDSKSRRPHFFISTDQGPSRNGSAFWYSCLNGVGIVSSIIGCNAQLAVHRPHRKVNVAAHRQFSTKIAASVGPERGTRVAHPLARCQSCHRYWFSS